MAAWESLGNGEIAHQELADRLCEQESRTLKELYGPTLVTSIHGFVNMTLPALLTRSVEQSIKGRNFPDILDVKYWP